MSKIPCWNGLTGQKKPVLKCKKLKPISIHKFMNDLGFKEINAEIIRPDNVDDRDPDCTFWSKDGKKYALIGHNLEGHGAISIFEVVS